MNKIFKPFILFFRMIYRLLDRLIITPISRLIYKINEFSKDHSGYLEKILNRPNVLVYLSLFCAIALFLLIYYRVINLTERDSEILTAQKVNVIYNKEAYVVEGIPEKADIILIGSKSSVYIATQLGTHEVELDLSNYGPGTYKVKLKYKQNGSAIEYKLDPSTVNVKISEKVSEVKSLSYDIVNIDKLDKKYNISSVSLDTNEIIVKSSQEILDKVASVKAIIDATKIPTEAGKTTTDDVVLVAYDKLGNRIENVEMVPSKVTATLNIDSYHAKKPVKVVTRGTMNNGKAISSLVSSVKEVDVYGDKDVIDGITAIEAEVTIDNLNSNKSMSVNLIKPSGVRYMSETTTNVEIKISDATQKTIERVRISFEGLDENKYSASAVNSDDQFTDVIATGVKSVLDNELDMERIYAYVDLSGLKAGTSTVKVQIVYIDDSRITLKTTKSEIKIRIIDL